MRGCSTRAAIAPRPHIWASCWRASTACAFAPRRCRPALRRTIVQPADGSQDPGLLGEAIGRLLLMPPAINLDHVVVPRVAVAERLAVLRGLLRRGAFSFEDAVAGADRMTVAVTLFALLELYKRGEAEWEQEENFGAIAIHPGFAREPGGRIAAAAAGTARRLAG